MPFCSTPISTPLVTSICQDLLGSYLSANHDFPLIFLDLSLDRLVFSPPKTFSLTPKFTLKRFSSFLNRSTLLSRRCRNCNKKQLKSLTDSQVSRRCRDYLKTVFQEGKNIDMNVIKHTTQPRIQSTY